MKSAAELVIADASYLSRVLPLFRAYQAHYNVLTNAGEEQTRDFLSQYLAEPEKGFLVAAESEGQLVGFATGYFTVTGVMAERLVHLGDLYVVPEYRHRGIATALVGRVSEEALRKGIRRVRWLSLASNTKLNRWYQSLGTNAGEFNLFLRSTAKSPK